MPNSLDLEKQRIAERLSALEHTISVYMATTELRVKSRDEILDKLNHIIIGNGSPGIAEKVRDLEKIEDSRKSHNKIFYTAIVAGVGEWIWRTIGHFIK